MVYGVVLLEGLALEVVITSSCDQTPEKHVFQPLKGRSFGMAMGWIDDVDFDATQSFVQMARSPGATMVQVLGH